MVVGCAGGVGGRWFVCSFVFGFVFIFIFVFGFGVFLMWCTRTLRVEDREVETEQALGARHKKSREGERLMQLPGNRVNGLASGEERTLRRKPQLHVDCCKRRFPPHPGGMG